MNLSGGLSVGHGPRRPEHLVTLEPGAFADHFAERPRVAVQCGVRVVSEWDLAQAKSEAVKTACRLYPEQESYRDERVEAFNDALISWAVYRGTCAAQDVLQPFMGLDEDGVADVFAPPTIIRLYDEVVRVSELASPLTRDLTAPERADLAARLAQPLDLDSQTSRMLLWCLRRMGG